jgi:transposase InsO family protein
VLVDKKSDGEKTGEKRPCWDYRGPNELTVADAHPLPLPEALFDHLRGCRVFSKLDLTKGFWQIPLDAQSKEILAFSTPVGLKQPRFMPFGIRNAPASFQREMQRVLNERLYKGVVVFIDDILIYSKSVEEHAELVEWVLKRLKEEHYYANPKKCAFFQSEVSFLGHVVNENGVAVQQYKVKAVRDFQNPTKKKEVRSFLGMSGYYRRYINGYSRIARPLTDLIRDDVKFEWTEERQQAFDRIKEALTTAPVLITPDPQRQYVLHTDASGFAVSGVLSQDLGKGRQPIAYWSMKMDQAQMNYPVHEQELLAVVGAVENWRHYLEGSPHPILIFTDHHSLQWLNTQPHLSGRQSRWVEKLSELEFQLKHLPGKENKVADALSRRADYEEEAAAERAQERQDAESRPPKQRVKVTLAAIPEGVTKPLWEVRIEEMPLREDMKKAAQRDSVYAQRLKAPSPRTDGLIVGDGLLWTGDGVFYVPDDLELQRRLIHEVHDSGTGGHMGLRKTLKRLMAMCWWPGMKATIADYVGGCVTCAATKPSLQKPAGSLRPLPIPEKPWRVISIDFVGPLPMTKDYFNYVLVVVDKFSKMAHFIPTTSNVTAQRTARLLIDNVVRLHGIPEAIISDRGTQFVARLFQEVWAALGTELRMSTSYHPQSDGQTERTIRELEHQLRTHANRSDKDWKEWLSVVEMHYNSDVHESTGKTPYELNGVDWRDALALALQKPASSLTTEGAMQIVDGMKAAWEDARQVMLKQREQQKKYADQRRREERFKVGDQVMLSTENLAVGRGKLSDRYVGPFRVVEVRGNGVNVLLDLPAQFGRLHPVFHIEKLKRFTPSAIDWPGRVQVDRPPPVMVDGEAKYWAERLIGKKEEEVEEVVVTEDEKQSEVEQAEGDEQQTKDWRRSPRGHASSVHPPPRLRRRQRRLRKAKRMVVKYLVKWEGYGEEESTWQTEEELGDARELIEDYEQRQLGAREDVTLATMCSYIAVKQPNGTVELKCVQV